MAEPNFENKEDEYWFHVAPQEALPLAGRVEVDIDLNSAATFFKSVAARAADGVREQVAAQLLAQPTLFSEIRQFLGISDKRAYLDLSYIASRTVTPGGQTSICGCQPWTLARHPLTFFIRLLEGAKGRDVQGTASLMMADYLLRHGLQQSAAGFAAMSPAVLEMLYARLIAPKEYQQRAAKRRGHGCEAALAVTLDALGLEVVPPDKAANPMGARDPNVDLSNMRIVDRTAGKTHSFDLIISRDGGVQVLIQSLIHTSDPGQYGVNKSDETVAITREVQAWTAANRKQPVELWAFLDGVGFSENKPDTINKLLAHVDCFVQLRTLFKAALRAHQLGLAKVRAIRFSDTYTEPQKAQLAKLYVPDDVIVLRGDGSVPNCTEVEAGDAVIFVEGARRRIPAVPELLDSLIE